MITSGCLNANGCDFCEDRLQSLFNYTRYIYDYQWLSKSNLLSVRELSPPPPPDCIPWMYNILHGPYSLGSWVRGGPYSLREYGPPDRKLGRTVYPMTPVIHLWSTKTPVRKMASELSVSSSCLYSWSFYIWLMITYIILCK